MNQHRYRIRGTPATPHPPPVNTGDTGVTVGNPRGLIPGRARDGVSGEEEVAADELVRVTLENDFVLWTRADSLVREHGRRSLSRAGGEAWEFDALTPGGGAARGERGLVGLGIKVLDFFGVDLAGKTASELSAWFENKRFAPNGPGLHRCTLEDAFQLTPLAAGEALPADGPLLILLHGTASSCQRSFGKLWDPAIAAGRGARERLRQTYGERVFALEHRTLTESPIANALDLVRRLPEGAKLDLVSHSRGGLVGELLALGGCEQAGEILTAARLKELFAADRTIAEQLGLSPLDEEEEKARDAAYDADRGRLVELLGELATRRIEVRRFVRVACPARGTTLASGRLDRWLSVVGFLAGKAAGVELFEDSLDFVLAVVKERTDPRTLPGAEAMMPGSALTRLLHHPALVTRADLSVIAGDVEGDSPWRKVKLLATDWFYGADHDLVVNTGSMSGGLQRPPRGARFREDKGAAVNHFAYFGNERSIQWLVAGLTRADDGDGGFMPIEAAQKAPPRWRGAVERSQRSATPRPLAIVLPGTLGSQLRADGEQIWLNYWALLRGGLRKLAWGQAREVAPGELIDDFYGPLLEFLAHTHRVQIFGYDWRDSVTKAAARLAERIAEWLPQAEREQQPVHIVAHSMGGLVVRAMIADGGAGSALWRRIAQLPNSRFLMLGTPNLGSHEAVRWLTGFNPTAARLALLDFTQSTTEIVDLVRDFPGLLELLPFAPADEDFADPARWQRIKADTRARWQTAREERLREARATWQRLRAAGSDPRLMCYVAGCQPATVIDYRLVEDETLGRHGQKRLEFLATREGDGTVSWASGRLPEVPTWFLEDTGHDALCTQRRAFPAYLELLQAGSTRRLSATPPAGARAADGEPATFVLQPTPPADGVPAETELASFGFGGGRPAEVDERPPVPTITVSIRHGDLSYARHPVMVGHYHGDTIVSAEKALDRKLGNALSRRHFLGLYPGRLPSHAVFFNETINGRPGGAIVVGLGEVGELTPGTLEAGCRAALLDYALQVAKWPDPRFGPKGKARHASVSSLLVGTGAGGMPVRDSMEAILRAAVGANARLVEAELDDQVTVNEIEFHELYEDIAINAAEALEQILQDGELATTVSWPSRQIERGTGGHRRVRFEEAPEWWHRLEIIEDEGRIDALRFIFATDRARAEETLATGQLALAESFIRAASRSARANPEAARTLFEMLLPLRLKEMAPRQGDLVLLVDERSARFPWELLEDRWSDRGRPYAVACGLVRQLKTAEYRARPAHAFETHALVVGNPDLEGWESFGDLPGAREEARKVTDRLIASEYRVVDCIDASAGTIIESLHRDAWRILHLAGHGEHDFELPLPPRARPGGDQAGAVRKVSGMVIGKDTFLTPGDIEQMRWVPELVFINCCHLGRTSAEIRSDRGLLAANLGIQFIRMGVRAVVAAGWAVDDAAALAFADTFYARMLAGETFGDAVRAAREESWRRFPGANTWGAYQCYGDPAFRLRRGGPPRARAAQPYHSPFELVADLDNLAQTLKARGTKGGNAERTAAKIAGMLERIPAPQKDNWCVLAEVRAALGFAWGEAGCWSEAIGWLDKALAAEAGNCPLHAVEQRANYIVRRAVDEWRARQQTAPGTTDEQARGMITAVEKAIAELECLSLSGITEERLNLLGGACKRLALMQTTQEERRKALERMAHYYRRAFEHGQRTKAYAYTNFATARLLAGIPSAAPSGDWPGELQRELVRLADIVTHNDEANPNFWDAASLGDLDMVRLLEAGTALDKTADERSAACSALADQILARYEAALGRGASPRQRASLVENLDFVLDFADLPPLAAALHRIRDAIEGTGT